MSQIKDVIEVRHGRSPLEREVVSLRRQLGWTWVAVTVLGAALCSVLTARRR